MLHQHLAKTNFSEHASYALRMYDPMLSRPPPMHPVVVDLHAVPHGKLLGHTARSRCVAQHIGNCLLPQLLAFDVR